MPDQLMRDGILESIHIGACRRIPADALNTLINRLRGAEADAAAN